MPSKAVFDAVKTKVTAVFSSCPVRYPNDSSQPPNDRTAFMQVQFPVSSARQASMGSPGSNTMREEGAFRFVINVPSFEGVTDALTWADSLALSFNHQTFYGIKTWCPSPPVINDGNAAGGWYQVSIAVPYYYDFIA